jgi:flavin-dependent dehydrogenase
MPSLATAPRVVIAGAGPAGSAAASLLREAGAIVTVVERALGAENAAARSGSVVVGREAWDVLRRVGGSSLLDDARNAVSESEQLMSLRSIDTTLGAEAARRGASMIEGHAVTGVSELANGAGVSVAISDAKTGAARTLEADWFIDATGGKIESIAKDPRFSRELTQGPNRLLPRERPFAVIRAKADEARGVGWSGPGGAFAINDRVEGIVSAYRPLEPAAPTGGTVSTKAAKVAPQMDGTREFVSRLAQGKQEFTSDDIARLFDDLEIEQGSHRGMPHTFTARQTIAPHAAQGRILLAGDSVGTVMPATQAGTMLALTDAERAANAVIKAHAAATATEAAAVIDDYDLTTIAMHNVFIR